jgi:hypothetical protein
MRTAYDMLTGTPERSVHLGDTCTEERIILKWIFNRM